MAKAEFLEDVSPPKKFNKTVVLTLTPREAVALMSVLAHIAAADYKSKVYCALASIDIPELGLNETFHYGTLITDKFGDNVRSLAEGDD